MVNRKYSSRFPFPDSHFPIVSIVITTKNEEKNIEDCLKSIRNQTFNSQFPIPNSRFPIPNSHSHPLIEIIVVDNNSQDKTKEIAYKYTDKVYNFGPERSAQRNFGVKQASGKYILYLDADMILSENVIKECVEKFRKEEMGKGKGEIENRGEEIGNGKQELVALYIPEKIIGSGFWIKVRDFERSFYNATVIDCVRFVRRDKFLEIGGFDEHLTGPEDWDFDRRIREKGKVGIINSPIYHNEGEFNLGRYLEKKSYYTRTFNKYIEKWGENDKVTKKQLGFWYRYMGVFFEDRKWQKLIMHPRLTLGMYMLRILVGVQYLKESIRHALKRRIYRVSNIKIFKK